MRPRLIVCSLCGRPLSEHCRVHFDPCCRGHCKSVVPQTFTVPPRSPNFGDETERAMRLASSLGEFD